MALEDFNKNHPEIREGEVFLTIIRSPEDPEYNLSHIGWVTKRMGSVAYDSDGKSMPGWCPVFVQREELIRNRVNPEEV